jgi:acyl-CoA reductase-like NAD-dependent aldehyde dehydrogenase
VLAYADIEKAAEAAAGSRFKNAGQVCIAAKRFIVEAAVRREFEAAFIAAAEPFKPADPEKDDTKLGPMARGDLRDELSEQVEKSIRMGAKVLKAGGVVEGPGFFYNPAILADGPDDQPAFAEETFGPAALIVTAKDADDAVAIANRSRYGLSANLWTADTERAKALAPGIGAGGVYVNGTTASDPRFPFGGIKRSGYGRELGEAGAKEFINLKTIRISK